MSKSLSTNYYQHNKKKTTKKRYHLVKDIKFF